MQECYIKRFVLVLGLITAMMALSPAQSAGENQPRTLKELAKMLGLPMTPTPTPPSVPPVNPTASPQPNEVKEFILETGKPMVVKYHDNRELQAEDRGGVMWFWTNANMAENTCTRKTGIKCKIVIPIEYKTYIARWTQHPTRQGQVVVSGSQPNVADNSVVGTSLFVSPLQRDQFRDLLIRLNKKASRNEIEERIVTLPDGTLGWLECGQSVFEGQITEIQYWDENFETGNSEIGFFQSDIPSVNQIVSRLQSVKISERDGNVYFSVPKRSFGIFSQFLPPAVTYQIQWTINKPSLVETGSPTCDVKWDINFGRIFTQFTSLSIAGRPLKEVKVEGFKPYFYEGPGSQSLMSNYFFTRNQWDRQELK